MFKRLFKKNKPEIPKLEYWNKWELYDLLDDLHLAVEMIEKKSGCVSDVFSSSKEFSDEISNVIEGIESWNKTDLTKIWLWFAPTCAWDDFMGTEGSELGNKIFERVDRWKKAYDKEKFRIRKYYSLPLTSYFSQIHYNQDQYT